MLILLEEFFERIFERIERTGNSARLAWPLAATGYHVQTTPLLATNTAWISNATTFAVTNGKNVLTTNIPAATNQLFFRLRKP